MDDIRLRRTMMFVPGISEKMIRKAEGLGSDSLILDLEDAVEESKKAEARGVVAKALKEVNFPGKEVCVRVNALNTEHMEDDVLTVLEPRLDAVVLPKVERPEDVKRLDEMITGVLKDKGIPDKGVKIVAMIETPLGVLNSFGIALSSQRLIAFLFGAADFSKETRGIITKDRRELLYPMNHILLSARAQGLDAIDTPFFNIRDPEGLEEHAWQARRMGYDGKSVIHPSQIEIVNKVFSPTPEEIDRARRIIEAFEDASKGGKGVAVVDGDLVEALHAHQAKRVLAMAEKIGH